MYLFDIKINMNDNFEIKKQQFFTEIHFFALRHNRNYYVPLIPFVEKITDLVKG